MPPTEMDDTYLSFGSVPRSAQPFQIGERVGGMYHLRKLLGRGGMSHVFEADDVVLSRKVAIKVLDDAEQGGAMLVREAQALAAVRHPGLPIVHGVGVHRGWTYLILERVYGITLEDHLLDPRGGVRMRPEQALPILAAIADVLAAVHGAGLAHRDLKPANVMLSPGDRVVLLDFGIVLPEVDAAGCPRCGTPRYLAPEVAVGVVTPGQAHLVDVYAFGAMAFEMFAGRPIFEATSIVELLEHHRSTPPPDLALVRPDVPPSVCRLVAACLAKNPGERPQDMELVAWELRALARRLVDGSGPIRVTPGTVRGARETYRTPRRPQPSPPEILIVEDDEDIRDGLADVLAKRGFRTLVAAHGGEALDQMRQGRRPSVILLDLMMPVVDGQSFLESQSRDPSLDQIPVLLVTAQPPARALAYPAVRGVVPKPLDASGLVEMIRRVCDGGQPRLDR